MIRRCNDQQVNLVDMAEQFLLGLDEFGRCWRMKLSVVVVIVGIFVVVIGAVLVKVHHDLPTLAERGLVRVAQKVNASFFRVSHEVAGVFLSHHAAAKDGTAQLVIIIITVVGAGAAAVLVFGQRRLAQIRSRLQIRRHAEQKAEETKEI